MGNSKSKKVAKEPTNFFERQKYQQNERDRMVREMASRRPELEIAPPRPINRPLLYHQPPAISYDDEAIKRMRRQLQHDATAFLLNNIMLSVQFFENYERVILDLKNNSSAESDGELNIKMAPHQKHVFLPDKLLEALHSYVQYKPQLKGNPHEDIIPQRMFVMHDNIEVSEPGEVSDYSTVLDAMYYKMLMEESEEPGYVMLKKIEILGNKITFDDTSKDESLETEKSGECSDVSDASIESNDEVEIIPKTSKISHDNKTEGENFMDKLKSQIENTSKPTFKVPKNLNEIDEKKYVKNKEKSNEVSDVEIERRPSGILKNANQNRQLNAVKKPRDKKPKANIDDNKISPNGSESSGYMTSYSPQDSIGNESDYGYATIITETTPRKLEISQSAKFSDSSSVIPLRCITKVTVKKMIENKSDDEDEIDVAYSARYGSDFPNNLYKNIFYLNSKLFMENFNDVFLLKLSAPLGFTLDSLSNAMTQGSTIYCNMIKDRQITSLEIMPAANANWPRVAGSWLIRKRNNIENPRTNIRYQWPTPYMVNKARGLGCTIIPIGFRPTRGINPKQVLQWKLTFPQVERYLESCLAHSQVRCYIFTQLLFKTFIKTENVRLGLDYQHIRNHLFWQCEDNYAKWPEDRLGESLRLFLNSFYEHLKTHEMPDYFIPQCNILKGIPRPVLLKQQRKLFDIIESPVIHLLMSLRNLKYIKSDFYPVFNYQKLYKILTTDDIMRLVNPYLPRMDNEMDEDDSDDEYKKERSFWEEMKHTDSGYRWKKQQQRHIELRKAEESIQQKKVSKSFMNRKIILPANLETHRRRMVLDLFINHFISMADCSEKFETTRQAMIYLEHARRLGVLMKDEPASEGQAREYIAVINEKLDHLKLKVARSGAPEVPKRNGSFSSGITRLKTNSLKNDKPSDYINVKRDSEEPILEKPTTPPIKTTNITVVDVHVSSEKPKVHRCVSFQKVEEESDEISSDTDEPTVSKL